MQGVNMEIIVIVYVFRLQQCDSDPGGSDQYRHPTAWLPTCEGGRKLPR